MRDIAGEIERIAGGKLVWHAINDPGQISIIGFSLFISGIFLCARRSLP